MVNSIRVPSGQPGQPAAAQVAQPGQLPLAPIPRVTLRIDEAAMAIGLSERNLWELAKKKEVPCFKQGKLLLFAVRELLDWATERTKQHMAAEDN